MGIQDKPICFGCTNEIDDPLTLVFEALCGHESCPSAAWHGLCLMEWREKGREESRRYTRYVRELLDRAREFGLDRLGGDE